MTLFRFVLFCALLLLYDFSNGQLSMLPVSNSWNADTTYAGSASSALWRGNQMTFQTSGLASIPELRQHHAQAYKVKSNHAFGFSSYHNGTDFFKHSRLTFAAAHRTQFISTGINLKLLHYYAKEYYSLYRFQCDIHSMARLMKGRAWFSMHLNNLLPSPTQRLMYDPMQLSLSVSYRAVGDLRIGVQENWLNKTTIEHILWTDLRWNRIISTVFSYHLKEKLTTVGMRIFYRRHSWQNTATLFYKPGFLWSCAYSYSW